MEVFPPGKRQALDEVFRDAVACRYCFHSLGSTQGLKDLAEPRWIGPNYWDANPRVAIVTPFPGSGAYRKDAADAQMTDLIRRFRDGTGTIAEVFSHQLDDIHNWGRGRFASFFFEALPFAIEDVALVCMAWCSTADQKHPSRMFSVCFQRHTRRLLTILEPNVVLLSGSAIRRYRQVIVHALPQAVVVSTLNYAHREGRVREQDEIGRVRRAVANCR